MADRLRRLLKKRKQQLNSKNDFKSPKIINSEENKVVKIRNK